MDSGTLTLGVDIGGTHISAALVLGNRVLEDTWRRMPVNRSAEARTILDTWAGLIRVVMGLAPAAISGIGIAMPGPFDYTNGISMIRGLNKYEHLFGVNIREALLQRLFCLDLPICFENDAACFGLGEARLGAAAAHRKLIAITLGTGFGACFLEDKQLLTTGQGIPPNGYLYNVPFKNGIAEDYISARWLISGYPAQDVREIAEQAAHDEQAAKLFAEFGSNLKKILSPWINRFDADALVIGGSISKAWPLFSSTLQVDIPVLVTDDTERMAVAGAASMAGNGIQIPHSQPVAVARKSFQPRLPKYAEQQPASGYSPYPFEALGSGYIFSGYDSLARWIIDQQGVCLDGYSGIDWSVVRKALCAALRRQGASVLWYDASAWMKPRAEIDRLVESFLGQEGSVWGTRTTLQLSDFFTGDLQVWKPNNNLPEIVVLAGTGAGLSGWQVPIVYLDIPKNEIQYRMRAGSATNIGSAVADRFSEMYKRCYFVDWVVLNAHRRAISADIAVVMDGQREEEPNWSLFDSIRRGLHAMAHNVIRARPWFEPGIWGGQWIKQHIPALSKKEVNYAWSFELIAPENGIVFESDGFLLEIAFDWLMQWESEAVLGADVDRFKEEFPIRFDFLDTFGGGNLSIQCHPSLSYIRGHFGETLTQDETYYILDCKPGAGVYLGFQQDIEPAAFRQALEKSQAATQAIDIEEFVQLLPAHKHDLFLIPNQTIHGSGVNNLVLEISATPYIFTFKMYDWMRLDLEGMPRPINIEHAFHNLDFTRKGEKVQQELISRPLLLQKEDEMELELLPTHAEHFYSIHRITLHSSTKISTENRCHLLMLVEGKRITIKSIRGPTYVVHYAETIVLPAAAGGYTMINEDDSPAIIIKAFVK